MAARSRGALGKTGMTMQMTSGQLHSYRSVSSQVGRLLFLTFWPAVLLAASLVWWLN